MKRIFSGIQPSGNLHIGNYLGAIKNWVHLQKEPTCSAAVFNENPQTKEGLHVNNISTKKNTSTSEAGGYEYIFCIVDLHAITVPQDPKELQKRTLEIAKIYLAAGIDPEKSTIFIQSHIKEHSELAWLLNTLSKMSDLFRMTQFKDKTGVFLDNTDNILKKMTDTLQMMLQKRGTKLSIGTSSENNEEVEKYLSNEIQKIKTDMQTINKVGVGLFDYPVLMAADILLYDTEVVPVGEDQVQHIELARTLARRFNKRFGDTFTIPKAFIQEESMRIMGLDDPTKKMSKSASSEYNYISLLDTPEMIEKKIKKAVTDSGSEIRYSDDAPALKNLINIYASFSGKKPTEVVAEYSGKGYADFKAGLTEVILDFIIPFQEKYNSLDNAGVLALLKKGAEKAHPLAQQKIQETKQKIGFVL